MLNLQNNVINRLFLTINNLLVRSQTATFNLPRALALPVIQLLKGKTSH